jgi:hypothetical protein
MYNDRKIRCHIRLWTIYDLVKILFWYINSVVKLITLVTETTFPSNSKDKMHLTHFCSAKYQIKGGSPEELQTTMNKNTKGLK